MKTRVQDTFLTILIVWLLLFGSIALSDPPETRAAGDGVVSGQVVNRTTGQPVGGVEVTLSRFASQSPDSVDMTTTTAPDGAYRFEGLDTSDGLAYAASVRYLDVLYASSMILLSQQPQLQVDLAVYETTTETAEVSVESRALILTGIDADVGSLALTDVTGLVNNGDRTLVAGEDGRTVQFTVPDDVAEITPRPGFDFGVPSIEGNTVYATAPLRPGSATASLDYRVPYQGTSLDITITAGYPTGGVRILVPSALAGDELSIASQETPLQDVGVVTIGEGEYHVWAGGELPSGATIVLELSGLPEPAAAARRLRTLEPALVAFTALVIAVGIAGWIVIRRGLHHERPVVLAPALAVPVETRREQLVVELRQLESDWQGRSVAESDYRAARRAILEELRRISRQLRGVGEDE